MTFYSWKGFLRKRCWAQEQRILNQQDLKAGLTRYTYDVDILLKNGTEGQPINLDLLHFNPLKTEGKLAKALIVDSIHSHQFSF